MAARLKWLGWAAVACTVAATALSLNIRTVALAGTQLALVLAGVAAFAVLIVVERRSPFLTRRVVWAAGAVLLTAAVVLPPQGSKDVYAYAMYGRIAAQHHASPYTHLPAEYPGDPWYPRMSRAWHHTPSVYGPVFTGMSAAGMSAAGDSALGGRLFFQLLAALSVVGALLLLERTGAGPGALACVALNPVVASIVNGGHNDVLVGLAVLAAVVAVIAQRSPRLVGVLLGLGALVKMAGLLPFLGVVAWVALRRGGRAGASAAAWGMATVAGGYLLAGGPAALAPLGSAADSQSRASLWRGPGLWAAHALFGTASAGTLALAAAAVVAVVALVVIAGHVGDLSPVAAAGGAALVYLLAAAYVLPWYAGWTIPVFALAWRSRLTMLALAQSAVLLVVYVNRPGLDPDFLHHVMALVTGRAVPILELVALTALVVVSLRQVRRSLLPRLG